MGSKYIITVQKKIFFIEADEAFSKCACSVKYLHQLFAADRYLHAVICRWINQSKSRIL